MNKIYFMGVQLIYLSSFIEICLIFLFHVDEGEACHSDFLPLVYHDNC